MQLSNEQRLAFERDGFLILPALFDAAEVAALRDEVDRVSRIDDDSIFRPTRFNTFDCQALEARLHILFRIVETHGV